MKPFRTYECQVAEAHDDFQLITGPTSRRPPAAANYGEMSVSHEDAKFEAGYFADVSHEMLPDSVHQAFHRLCGLEY